MLDKITPDRWDGADCFQLSATNVLKFKGYNFSKTIWKQCGLVYKTNIRGLGNIRGSYMSLQEELNWIHKVKKINVKITDSKEYLKEICKKIDSGEPIIVFCDTYGLSFNMYFQKKHMLHTLILVGYEDDFFITVDDAFNYKGKVSFEEILHSQYLINENNNIEFEYIYLSTIDAKSPEESDYLEVLKRNINYLNGDNITLDNENTIYGVKGLHQFCSDLDNIKINYLEEAHIYNLYTSLVRVANHHHLFANFLKEGSFSTTVFNQNLINEYYLIAQDWKVASLMVLKGLMNKQPSFYERMKSKINDILPKEKSLLKLTNDVSMNLLKD